MTWIVVDCEADGPAPGPTLYSMVSFGAVVVTPNLQRTFKGLCAPISERWDPDALAVSGISRDTHLTYPEPVVTMARFAQWIDQQTAGARPTFISDNLAFDWCWIHTYFHLFYTHNPFGFSGRRLNDLFAGWQGDANQTTGWKQWRRTPHDHDPVHDALGMAEGLLEMKRRGLILKAIPELP